MLNNNITKPHYYNHLLKYLNKDVISIIYKYTKLQFILQEEALFKCTTSDFIKKFTVLNNQTIIISKSALSEFDYHYQIILIDLNEKYNFDKDNVIFEKKLMIYRDYTNDNWLKQSDCLVAFDNSRILIQSNNYNLQLINVFTKKSTLIVTGHIRQIKCIKIINKNLIVTGSEDNTIRVFDLKQNKNIKTFKYVTNIITFIKTFNSRLRNPDGFGEIAVINDSTIVACSSIDYNLRIFNLNENTNFIVNLLNLFASSCILLQGHTAYVTSVVVSNDKIVSSAYDNTLRIWDFNGKILHVIDVDYSIARLYALNDDSILLVYHKYEFQILNIDNNKTRTIKMNYNMYNLDVFPDGRLLFLNSHYNCFEIYN
jgi:WD40 repeat protein